MDFAAVMFLGTAASAAGETGVRVGDAYARASADGRQWTIGTAAVELVLQCAEERFRLVSYQNKLVSPPQEYVDPGMAAAPFALQPTVSSAGRFVVEAVWEKFLPNSARFDPADDKLQLDVKKGDLIGFSVGPHGDYSGDETEWITTVDYGNERYTSSQDARAWNKARSGTTTSIGLAAGSSSSSTAWRCSRTPRRRCGSRRRAAAGERRATRRTSARPKCTLHRLSMPSVHGGRRGTARWPFAARPGTSRYPAIRM